MRKELKTYYKEYNSFKKEWVVRSTETAMENAGCYDYEFFYAHNIKEANQIANGSKKAISQAVYEAGCDSDMHPHDAAELAGNEE